MLGKTWKNYQALLVYTAITLVFFFPAFMGQYWPIFGDNLYMHFPLRDYAFEQIKISEFPFWNPFIFSGFPLFANMQAGILFPLNIFYFLLDSKLVFSLQIIMTYIIAAYGMFYYCKEITKSFFASFFSGLIFAYSGFMIFKMENLPVIQQVSLMPFLIYFIEKSKDKFVSIHTLLAGLILACQILAGHPQISFYTIILIIFYQFFFYLSEDKPKGISIKRPINLLIVFTIGISISFVQILPTIMLALNSSRINFSFEEFAFGSIPPLSILSTIFPYFWGSFSSNGLYLFSIFNQFDSIGNILVYIGILPLIFTFIGLRYIKTNKFILFWSIIAFLSVFMAIGSFNPLYKTLYYMPVFNFFRYPEKYIILYYFAISVLSAIGIQKIASAIDLNNIKFLKLFLVMFVSLILFGLGLILFMYNNNKTLYIPLLSANYIIPAFISLLSFLSAFYFIKNPCLKTKSIILSVIIIDLLVFFGYFSGWQPYAKSSSDFLQLKSPQIKYLQTNMQNTERFLTEFIEKPIFIGEYHLLEPDYSMLARLNSVNGYDVLIPKRFLILFKDLITKHKNDFIFNYKSNYIQTFNIKYFISRKQNIHKYLNDNNFLKNWSIVYSDTNTVIFKNKSTLKPYKISFNPLFINDFVNLNQNINDINILKENDDCVLIENKYKNHFIVPKNINNIDYNIKILEQTPSKIKLMINTKSKGILNTSNSYYYFWKAYIDKKETEIFPVNINFLGLVVPEGKHTIELRIEDNYFNFALIVSLISTLSVILTGLYFIIYNKRSQNLI